MPALSKVVTNVKRRITVNTTFTSPIDEEPQPLPPDLKRFSDFMKPFPPVSPGGYTKYYLTHRNEDVAIPYSPLLSHSPAPSPSLSVPRSSTLFPTLPTQSSLRHIPTNRYLPSIAESSSETLQPQEARTHVRHHTKGSLRRRKRQLLRTPSVERDFAANFFRSDTSVGHCESISSSQSNLSHASHHSSSTDSHSSQSSNSTSSDYPQTPVDDDASSHIAYGNHFMQAKGEIAIMSHDPFMRPESWASYITARTEFSES